MNAVVTYIFGENAEILREPLVVDAHVDYICVTDQPSLTSEHWRIIVDELPQAKCTRDKMPLVKYNPFKYTDADHILVIDGTLQLVNKLDAVFDQLRIHDLLIKRHPQRTTLVDELNEWIHHRHMEVSIINKFAAMSVIDGISLTNNFLIESCVIGYTSNNNVKSLCDAVLKYMEFLGTNGKLCITNQCPFTYIVEKFGIPYGCIQQKDFAVRYNHNSWVLADR